MTRPSPVAGSSALTILPDLMHPVQALTRLVAPFTDARTRWMFGFQRRLVRRCECDTDMPHEGPLPHTSHLDAIGFSCSGAGITRRRSRWWVRTATQGRRDSHGMLSSNSPSPTPDTPP